MEIKLKYWIFFGEGTKKVFGAVSKFNTIIQAEDLTNMVIYINSLKDVNENTLNGMNLIKPHVKSNYPQLYEAMEEAIDISNGDDSGIWMGVARQIADGTLKFTVNALTDKFMGLWIDAGNYFTNKYAGTQEQVDGILNAWANLKIQDTCTNPLKTQLKRFEKANNYIDKFKALKDARDIMLVYMYAALNAQTGFEDELYDGYIISDINMGINDLMQYEEYEFYLPYRVRNTCSKICSSAYNSLVTLDIYWDQDYQLDIDVKADLSEGNVERDHETGSFNKTNGFSVVVSEYTQPGYGLYGVVDSANTVELYIKSVTEQDAWNLAYMDIKVFINGNKIENPYQYKDWDENGEYIKLVFKNGAFQE